MKYVQEILKWAIALIFLLPCLFLVYGCFVLKDGFSLTGFAEVVILKDTFLNFLKNSLILTLPVVLIQLFICVPAAYGFSQLKNPWVQGLFYLYVITMMMPFLVTLVPTYMLMQNLGVLGQFAAVILPKSFGVSGVFFLRQSITLVPSSVLEVARLDGCSEWQILLRIIVPLTKSNIFALLLMIFADCWNMVEEPLILLQSMDKYPLSILIDSEVQAVSQSTFIVSTFIMIVPIAAYLCLRNQLQNGIGQLLRTDMF